MKYIWNTLTSKHTSQLKKIAHQHTLELSRPQKEYDNTKTAPKTKELQKEQKGNKRDFLKKLKWIYWIKMREVKKTNC